MAQRFGDTAATRARAGDSAFPFNGAKRRCAAATFARRYADFARRQGTRYAGGYSYAQAPIACGLLSKAITPKHLYIALVEYIARTRGTGRVPLITQDERRDFRINRPADDLAATALEPLPRARADAPQAETLVSKLRATGAGKRSGRVRASRVRRVCRVGIRSDA